MGKRFYLILILTLGLWLGLTGAPEARRYRYVDLGAFEGGTHSEAWGLNDKGQIVGWAGWAPDEKTAEQPRATLWDLASWLMLDLSAGDDSCASAINESGALVGAALYSFTFAQAFYWDGDITHNFIYLSNTLGGIGCWANGLNDLGQVVGEALNDQGKYRAFLWNTSNRTMRDLGTLGGGQSHANGINTLGQIAGTAYTAAELPRAFRWDPGDEAMHSLGTLGGDFSYGFAINNLGQIVGASTVVPGYDAQSHAFVHTPGGTMRDLGTLGTLKSQAWGINDGGEVVGRYSSSTLDNGPTLAFRWTPGAGMKDLSSLVVNLPAGVTLANALGVNRKGWIVGYTSNNTGYLLIPLAAISHLQLLLGD